MKKLTSMLGLLAVAVGLTAAVAMAPAPEKATVKSSFTDLHWFRLTGEYLGSDSDVDKQAECGSGQIQCVRGYEQINEETEEPIGNPSVTLLGNKQL